MGQLGIYVERYTISSSDEMNSLMRLSQIARKLGHRADFLFRPDMYKIPLYDAIYIRALTDPLNSAYVAARLAEMHGIRVIDDPESIRICCDKVNMYQHLLARKVPIPATRFIEREDIDTETAKKVLEELGVPVVLKAPNSSFSMYVEKAATPAELVAVAKRFARRAHRIVAQEYMPSSFDWRVGLLGGEPLYICQYTIPKKRWKILSYTAEGRTVYGPVKAVPINAAPNELIRTAREAARAVGDGLYGVDLKQFDDRFVVIEVNDNPTINAGDEDVMNGDLYEHLIHFLLDERGHHESTH
ncbi:MAG TPA: RimK family alpha-L-glutamate ligase [candidate division Zixibacteria bacterium]|nr:RimK family alpha-L-glutamate ligase [candidate division Zixibacteria bacterium]